MRLSHLIPFFYLIVGFQYSVVSQTISTDTIGENKGTVNFIEHEGLDLIHPPKKAAFLSVIIPGAGQIYNKKWLKAPIVWVSIGTALYLGNQNRLDYIRWKDQYTKRIDPNQTDDYPNAPTNGLEQQMLLSRKNMETSYIVAGGIYVLQILDAYVDAHLMSFDVSDDLSMKVSPSLNYNQTLSNPEYGISLQLGFR